MKRRKKRLPKIVDELTGRNIDGPNCWNATMLFHGATKTVNFINDYEIEEWMKKNCRPLKKNERLKKGDILVMRQGDELIHTAVFIEKDTYWHKPGMMWIRGWEFATLEEIKEIYDEVDELQYLRKAA